MTQSRCIAVAVLLSWLITAAPVFAQNDRRVFVGGLIGVSTLSADGRAVTMVPEAALSSYKPENGFTINLFGGAHVAQYFSLQGNYMWNRNDLTLVSSFVTPQGGGFYEQRRASAQHAVVADALVYFRRIDSRLRPYLGTGLAVVRFSASVIDSTASGLNPPAGEITSTRAALRSHVGIDVGLSSRTAFRYSFSETIGGNPISPHLSPPGQRGLANFQNLFGMVTRF
jgi:hypothetical protein